LQQENRDRLILCGVYGHIGCLITACEAFMNDIQTFLVGDAVADFSWEYHHMAMNYVSQRCGMTVSSQAVVDALSDSHADGMQAETDLSSSVSVTEALRQQLGELLQKPPQEFGVEENLLDWGLDSIRLMNLVEMWRQKGVEVSFTDLAEEPTIAAWTQRLVDDRAIGRSRE
jgi:bifunctional isochorismate lyase/aryl carrier protein